MAYVETRLYTEVGQIGIVQPNETDDGLVLVTREQEKGVVDSRLYLTFDEAKELASLLEQSITRLKK